MKVPAQARRRWLWLTIALLATTMPLIVIRNSIIVNYVPAEVLLIRNHSSSYFMKRLLDNSTAAVVMNISLPVAMKNLPKDALAVLPAFILDHRILSCLLQYDGCANAISGELCLGYLQEDMQYIKQMFRDPLFVTKGLNDIANTTGHHSGLFNITWNNLVLKFYLIQLYDSYWIIKSLHRNGQQDGAILSPSPITYQIGKLALLGPDDPDLFDKLLTRSKLLDCNLTSAAHFAAARKNSSETSRTISYQQFLGIVKLRDLMHSINMIPTLNGGTLLGWYRECGLIPYTSDMDLALSYHMWSEDFTYAVASDSNFSMYWLLGEEKDSLEYTMYYERARIDVFILYHNKTHSWLGGMIPSSKTKLRYTYPLMEGPCSALLLGHLFNVPCNVVEWLRWDYGPTWHKPVHQRNYVWYATPSNVEKVSKYSDEVWKTVYRTKLDDIKVVTKSPK